MCVASRRSQWFEVSVATVSALTFFGIGMFLRNGLMHGCNIEHAPDRTEGRSGRIRRRGRLRLRGLSTGGINKGERLPRG